MPANIQTMAIGELFRGAANNGGDEVSLRETADKLFCAGPPVKTGGEWRMRALVGRLRGIAIDSHRSLSFRLQPDSIGAIAAQ
jgi:hypothetical protein